MRAHHVAFNVLSTESHETSESLKMSDRRRVSGLKGMEGLV